VLSYRTEVIDRVAARKNDWDLSRDLVSSSELIEIPIHLDRCDEFQFLVYGENRQALLIVLQGLSRSLKEDVIKHVLGEFSPRARKQPKVTPPTVEELAHEFFCRADPQAKTQVEVVVFNRSHDEEVIIAGHDELVFEKVRVSEAAFLGATFFSRGLNDFLKLGVFRWIRTMDKTENLKLDEEFTGPFPRYSGAISAVTDGSPEDINEMPACLNKTEECTIYGDYWPGSSKLEVVLIRGL
jgi:hypothetical protein